MSSTHSGNPACAAAALACLTVLEQENLIEASAEAGVAVLERMRRLQKEFPEHVRSVHGRGLFISAHLGRLQDGEPNVELGDSIVAEAVRRGVMMFPTHRGFLKITPPLCIDKGAAFEAVDVIRDFFALLIGA